jgi:uncharacterized membrane protein YadS
LFVSFIGVPKEVVSITKNLSSIGLTVAMVGIGLGISFKKLLQTGMKALSFGIVIFLSFLLILLGLIWVLL